MTTYSMPFTPVLPVNGLRKEIDRLFDDVFVNGRAGNGAGWKPAVEVRENREGFVFEYDVPGIAPESLEVLMEDGMLVVRGERTARELMEGERRLVSERFTGHFEHRFRMPKSADANSISATHAHGVLAVRVPKVAPAQPRRVPISVDGQTQLGSDNNAQISAPESGES